MKHLRLVMLFFLLGVHVQAAETIRCEGIEKPTRFTLSQDVIGRWLLSIEQPIALSFKAPQLKVTDIFGMLSFNVDDGSVTISGAIRNDGYGNLIIHASRLGILTRVEIECESED